MPRIFDKLGYGHPTSDKAKEWFWQYFVHSTPEEIYKFNDWADLLAACSPTSWIHHNAFFDKIILNDIVRATQQRSFHRILGSGHARDRNIPVNVVESIIREIEAASDEDFVAQFGIVNLVKAGVKCQYENLLHAVLKRYVGLPEHLQIIPDIDIYRQVSIHRKSGEEDERVRSHWMRVFHERMIQQCEAEDPFLLISQDHFAVTYYALAQLASRVPEGDQSRFNAISERLVTYVELADLDELSMIDPTGEKCRLVTSRVGELEARFVPVNRKVSSLVLAHVSSLSFEGPTDQITSLFNMNAYPEMKEDINLRLESMIYTLEMHDFQPAQITHLMANIEKIGYFNLSNENRDRLLQFFLEDSRNTHSHVMCPPAFGQFATAQWGYDKVVAIASNYVLRDPQQLDALALAGWYKVAGAFSAGSQSTSIAQQLYEQFKLRLEADPMVVDVDGADEILEMYGDDSHSKVLNDVIMPNLFAHLTGIELASLVEIEPRAIPGTFPELGLDRMRPEQ